MTIVRFVKTRICEAISLMLFQYIDALELVKLQTPSSLRRVKSPCSRQLLFLPPYTAATTRLRPVKFRQEVLSGRLLLTASDRSYGEDNSPRPSGSAVPLHPYRSCTASIFCKARESIPSRPCSFPVHSFCSEGSRYLMTLAGTPPTTA